MKKRANKKKSSKSKSRKSKKRHSSKLTQPIRKAKIKFKNNQFVIEIKKSTLQIDSPEHPKPTVEENI